jgi:predicted amidophosphoribosyltransferase
MNLLSDFVSLFYPRCCVACSESLIKGEEVLCTMCLTQLPKTSYHRHEYNPVRNRLMGRLPLRHAFAFLKFRKGGLVQNLLHELKYNNRPEIGVRIGMLYGQELLDAGFGENFDLIVPVPLHAARMRKRGYNQSAKFECKVGGKYFTQAQCHHYTNKKRKSRPLAERERGIFNNEQR